MIQKPSPPLSLSLFPYLIVLFLYYVLVSLSGYGADDDVFRMLKSGQELFLNHTYHPSRFQGYLFPEIVIGITSLIGDHYLANFISVVLGISVLYLFYYFISKVFDREVSLVLTLIVGLNPYFVIAASSSIDYIYGLFFLLAGTFFLQKKHYAVAVIIFALALSSRMANSLLVGFVFAYFLTINYKHDKKATLKIFVTGFIALLLTVALYIPAYIASDHTFKFLDYYIQGYDWTGYITRFAYKNIAFISLLSTLFLYGFIAYNLIKKRIKFKQSIALYFIIAAIIVEQLKFLKIPIQISFLIPVFMLMVSLYPYLLKTKKPLYIMLGLTLFYNLVSIDFLRFTYSLDEKDKQGETLVATGAELGLFIGKGIIIQDIDERKLSRAIYFKKFNLPVQKK